MKTYRAALISIITTFALIVSGCSIGGKVDEALVAKCEILRANLAKLTYTPEFTKVDDPIDTFNYLSLSVNGYIAGNIGMKSRAEARNLIVAKHPYIADYLSQATGNEFYFDNAIQLAILEKAIEGTGFTLSLTEAQKQNTKGDFEDPSYDLLQKELYALGLKEDYNSEDPAGCAIVDKFNYEQSLETGEDYDMRDALEYKWIDYAYAVENAIEMVGITNTCEKTGEFNSRECGKKDYISTQDYSSTPATPTNPWERDWRDQDTEIMAKTVWCISNGYSDYNKATDGCK